VTLAFLEGMAIVAGFYALLALVVEAMIRLDRWRRTAESYEAVGKHKIAARIRAKIAEYEAELAGRADGSSAQEPQADHRRA